MSGLLLHLTPEDREQLLDDLSYLNLSEIRSFCNRHSIPYKIIAEPPDGRDMVTVDTDRKPVILQRVRHYLQTGEVLEATRIPSHIVRSKGPPDQLTLADRLYYRWYNKTYQQVIALLEELTGGRFRNGALARVLIMEYWTKGEAPTFEEFAQAWLAAKDRDRDLMSPDYAFLADLQRGEAGPDWKVLRKRKAQAVRATLDGLPL